jgi:hypothetical protein
MFKTRDTKRSFVLRIDHQDSASIYEIQLLPVVDLGAQINPGYEPAEGESLSIRGNVVSPGFFETIGTPIVHGRGFEVRDEEDSQPVIIVNQTFARCFWPGEDPLGKRVATRGSWRQVVGVARDAKVTSLADEAQPYIYLSLNQHVMLWASLIVRTRSSNPMTMAEPIMKEIRAIDGNLLLVCTPMAEQVQMSQFGDVLGTVGSTSFALLGGSLWGDVLLGPAADP